MKETGWSMVCLITATLFLSTCGLMSTLDTGGGPCGQGILIVFLLPIALVFGVVAFVSGKKWVRMYKAERADASDVPN